MACSNIPWPFSASLSAREASSARYAKCWKPISRSLRISTRLSRIAPRIRPWEGFGKYIPPMARISEDLASVYAWLLLKPEDLLKRCRQDRFQASGPGGQKRNRVYSGVRLTHSDTGLSVEACARRESLRNLEDALHRLRLELALAAVSTGSDSDPASALTPAAAAGNFRGPEFRPDASAAHQDYPGFALRALHQL